MTPADLTALRGDRTRKDFYAALGVAVSTGRSYERGTAKIPLVVRLACAAIALDLGPFGE